MRTSYTLMALLLSACFQLIAAENRAINSSDVGRVTLLIGKAFVTHSNGLKEPLQKNSPVYVGDFIETQSGSHVHVKFIDDAAVSVRPKSQLHIQLYTYDQQSPEKSAIRFTLEKGIMRSISGKATEAAHERYRLNTPVAALGVLGTDYVVKTNEDEIWVAVYSGGVAVKPLGDDCLVVGLGVCDGATRLTKDMGDYVLSYRAGDQQVRLKSLAGTLDEEKAIETDVVPEVQILKSTDSPVEEQLAEREQLGEDLNVVIEKKELSGALAWGRWWSDPLAGDQMSVSYADAKNGREITIGNSRFGLFRDTATAFQLMPQQGVFNFNLIQSFVYFFDNNSADGIGPTQGVLKNGSLEIDFAQDTFSTHLNLNHSAVGDASLHVQGAIEKHGVFASRNETSSVAGALTGDGKEAGLLFQHRVNSGVFKGISDWAR